MLLLLDNCEHVLDAVAELVDELLVDGTELAVLATSRVPLDVDGERRLSRSTRCPCPRRAATTAPARPSSCSSNGWPRRGSRADPTTSTTPPSSASPGSAGRSTGYRWRSSSRPPGKGLQPRRDRRAGRRRTPAPSAASGGAPPGHHRTVRFAVEQSYRTLSADEARAAPGGLGGARPVHRRARRRARRRGRSPRCATLLARLVHCSLLVPLGPLGPGGRRGSRSSRPSAGTPPTQRRRTADEPSSWPPATAGSAGSSTPRRGSATRRARLVRRTRRRPGRRCAPRCSTASPTRRPRSACGWRRGWGCTGTTAG